MMYSIIVMESEKMKIYIATDHRGIDVEQKIVDYLSQIGIETGRCEISHHETDDYVDFAFDIANKVANDKNSLGILLCGTGIGMSIAANKIRGIRAARCVNVDDAYYSKCHNNANIICLSSQIEINYLFEIIDTFINTKPAEEEKHIRRVEKIINFENGAYNEL